MRFYWIQEESSGVLEFDKISSYPAGSAEESQSSTNFNEKPRILHGALVGNLRISTTIVLVYNGSRVYGQSTFLDNKAEGLMGGYVIRLT